MARDRKDRSANWIIERHGGSMLRLANITNFVKWQPAANVLTFPKQIPDGLLDVTFADRPAPDPFLIEVETFPGGDTAAQIRNDAAMVLLARGVLPDILLVILAPKGNLDVPSSQVIQSSHGLTELHLRIRVIKLWTLSADDLLATDDVGLIPWVPLTAFSGSPEALLQMCRERIEKQALPTQKANLLATTHVMAEMRYNDLDLMKLLGVSPMSMQDVIDASPWIRSIKADTARETATHMILRRLRKRFGAVPEDVGAHLRSVNDQQRLDSLLDAACDCADLEGFRAALNSP
jgi:hypothetical protein